MTTQLKVLLCALAGGGALAILVSMLRARRLFRYLLLSAVSGVAALYAVNALGLLTGMRLAVNGLTLAVSAAAGPPGVIALLLADTLLR
ncbi:MAG: pro-sigmaK processing inhibitor BofA family protein [Oscillospiraceae bacterium]|nr:pro-sigmaK processing inhibitor BofA family protein [Oscillospiraceae bacterium]